MHVAYLFIGYVCVCVCDHVHLGMPLRTTWGSLFFLPPCGFWGLNLRIDSKCFYLLSHLASFLCKSCTYNIQASGLCWSQATSFQFVNSLKSLSPCPNNLFRLARAHAQSKLQNLELCLSCIFPNIGNKPGNFCQFWLFTSLIIERVYLLRCWWRRSMVLFLNKVTPLSSG